MYLHPSCPTASNLPCTYCSPSTTSELNADLKSSTRRLPNSATEVPTYQLLSTHPSTPAPNGPPPTPPPPPPAPILVTGVNGLVGSHVAAPHAWTAAVQGVSAVAHVLGWGSGEHAAAVILQQLYPEKKIQAMEDNGWDQTDVPNQRAEELLRSVKGASWATLEESVKAAAECFV
ncbi:hypothetical protein B0T17DRAFT_502490 [Bombardia bombarda]|uniref:Uncharacterized protein n=1 Tax=Bombardia bombarda TaxID=252184 RepID=A0AA39XIZ6_9PEZI|nr:hypothetical protein B0T17DRAFT_502490 [Bombardia bombarda]